MLYALTTSTDELRTRMRTYFCAFGPVPGTEFTTPMICCTGDVSGASQDSLSSARCPRKLTMLDE